MEMFKKRFFSSASLLEVALSASALSGSAMSQVKSEALNMINSLRCHRISPQLDSIAVSLRGKKIGFQIKIKAIDELVTELKKDQVDDDSKKEYCRRSTASERRPETMKMFRSVFELFDLK